MFLNDIKSNYSTIAKRGKNCFMNKCEFSNFGEELNKKTKENI